MNFNLPRLLLLATLAASTSGCATLESRVTEAGRGQGEASQVKQALAIVETPAPALPPLPADCRTMERAGVKPGDRADAAVLKFDAALSRANARTERCAGFYDDVKASREGTQ